MKIDFKAARSLPAQQERFKCVLYGDKGSGKSWFAYSFPDALVIDTENIISYSKFKSRLQENNGGYIAANTLEEMKEIIVELFKNDGLYKTLVIDSISVPYHDMCNREIDRLKKGGSEGTEFARHTTKAKRILFDIGQLLKRIDMNVILIAHQKDKYEGDAHIGYTSDIPDKVAYDLGCEIEAQRRGSSFKGVVKKSRYSGILKPASTFDLEFAGNENAFGYNKKAKKINNEKLATQEQIEKLKNHLEFYNVKREAIDAQLRKCKASCFEEVSAELMGRWIDFYDKKNEEVL